MNSIAAYVTYVGGDPKFSVHDGLRFTSLRLRVHSRIPVSSRSRSAVVQENTALAGNLGESYGAPTCT